MKKTVLLLTLIISILQVNVNGQAVFLDATFGAGGHQAFPITGSKVLNAVAADTNDYIYSAGYRFTNPGRSILITKSKQNGTSDNTFGNQGAVIANFNAANNDYLSTIAVTRSQKIVVGGYTTIGTVKNGLLARYKPNGNLDSTFGTNGVITTLTGTRTQISSLAVQSDDKIIAVGTAGTGRSSIWVARYNTDGSPDATFGINGMDTFHNTVSSYDSAIRVKIQSSGKIVIGGMTGDSYLGSMMLLRLNVNGSLDNTFGTNGRTVYSNYLVVGTLVDMVVLQDGSIIANDYRTGSNSSVRPFVKKFSVDGVFDATFNNAATTGFDPSYGVVLSFSPIPINVASRINTLEATADGGVLGGGEIATYGDSGPVIVKLKANGQLDSSFGVNGLLMDEYVSGPALSWRRSKDIVIQKDGKIVMGMNLGEQGSLFEVSELARYTAIPLYLGPDASICPGSSITLDAQNAGSTYLWSNGAITQTITISDSGTYAVRVTNTKGSVTDTIHIAYHPQPVVHLGNDTTICYGNTITIDAQNAGAAFLWNNGATSQTISVNNSGTYSVAVTNVQQCTGRDTMQVTVNSSPVIVDLGTDTTFCEGNGWILNAQNQGAAYLWSNGATSQTINANTTGTYSVMVTDANQCRGFDTVQVMVNPLPAVTLGNDTTFCAGGILDAGNAGASFLWNNDATTQSITVTVSGTYHVTVTDPQGCSKSDTIAVIANPLPVVYLGNDTFAANGSIITLDAGNPGATYSWSDGGATQTHNVINTGIYSVIVTDANGCSGTDSIAITFGVVGISQRDKTEAQIIISPNPATETITINIDHLSNLLNTPVTVTDAAGRVVKTIVITDKIQSYSLAGLHAGIYFLKTIYGGNYKIVKR